MRKVYPFSRDRENKIRFCPRLGVAQVLQHRRFVIAARAATRSRSSCLYFAPCVARTLSTTYELPLALTSLQDVVEEISKFSLDTLADDFREMDVEMETHPSGLEKYF